MNRKILFAGLIILVISYLFLASVNYSFASQTAAEQFDKSLKSTGGQAGYPTNTETGSNFPAFIGTILGYLLSFLGVIFLCLLIYAGYIWMMAKGNEQEVEKAKDILKNVFIGLLIILAAYAIVYGFNLYIGSNIIQPAQY